MQIEKQATELYASKSNIVEVLADGVIYSFRGQLQSLLHLRRVLHMHFGQVDEVFVANRRANGICPACGQEQAAPTPPAPTPGAGGPSQA